MDSISFDHSGHWESSWNLKEASLIDRYTEALKISELLDSSKKITVIGK